MNKKTDINPRAEEILNSLNGIHRATGQPYLYTRVMARINKNTTTRWEKTASLISRPAVAFAAIALFLLINAAVLFHFTLNTNSIKQDDSVVVSGNDYNLSVSSLYDINPE